MKNLKLKAARALKDMSQQELAKETGVSRQTINAIERGDYNPTPRLNRLSRETSSVTMNELTDRYMSKQECPMKYGGPTERK